MSLPTFLLHPAMSVEDDGGGHPHRHRRLDLHSLVPLNEIPIVIPVDQRPTIPDAKENTSTTILDTWSPRRSLLLTAADATSLQSVVDHQHLAGTASTKGRGAEHLVLRNIVYQ